MAVAPRAQTSTASSTGSVTLTPPTYSENDLLLIIAQGYNGTPALPSGWTNIDTQSGTNRYVRVCYKIAGSSEGDVTISDSGDSTRAKMISFSGVDTTSPIHATSKSTSYGQDVTCSGLTTTIDNALIVIAIGFYDGDNSDITNYSSFKNDSLASITEGSDVSDNTGSGGGIAWYYGTKTSAGAVSDTTMTADSTVNQTASITIALAPLVPDVTANAPASTATDAVLQVPTVTATRNVTASAPLSTASAEMAAPVISVLMEVTVNAPLMTASAETAEPSVTATSSADATVNAPSAEAAAQAETPGINTTLSATVTLDRAMEAASEAVSPRIFHAVINPIMSVDALGNLSIRGTVVIGPAISLDMFGNLTVAELIIGDKASISADGKLTAKSVTEYME